MFPEGFILGLSTGAVCLAYCGPVLLPFILGEGTTVMQNAKSVGLFLGGRLAAYILVGFFSGLLGLALVQNSLQNRFVFGIIYTLLALFMIAYGFHRFREICLGQKQQKLQQKLVRWSAAIPVAGGFVTGMNLCPPFLLAITGAVETHRVAGSILFFIMFFLGTSIYFIPMPFLGFFRRKQVLQIIGKFAAILAGLLYLYKGIFSIIR
jgi:sulfite exporter TauE/SafE